DSSFYAKVECTDGVRHIDVIFFISLSNGYDSIAARLQIIRIFPKVYPETNSIVKGTAANTGIEKLNFTVFIIDVNALNSLYRYPFSFFVVVVIGYTYIQIHATFKIFGVIYKRILIDNLIVNIIILYLWCLYNSIAESNFLNVAVVIVAFDDITLTKRMPHR